MARYIDADKLKEMLCGDCTAKDKLNCGYYKSGFDIDDIPTADVRPVVHGKWMEQGQYLTPVNDEKFRLDKSYKCSVCHWGCGCDDKLGWNYCPNCGARMEGEGA